MCPQGRAAVAAGLPEKKLYFKLLFQFRCQSKWDQTFFKVLSLLEACFDLILSPSLSMKIQILRHPLTSKLE